MINRVVLVGNITRDPELRKGNASNNSVVTFSIAINEYKGKILKENQLHQQALFLV